MFWFLLSCTLGYQQEEQLTTISLEQTQAAYNYNFSKVIKSSVRIAGLNSELEEAGHGSGNYFKIGQNRFILSAAHLIDAETVLYAVDGNRYVKLELMHADSENDIAIFIPRQKLKNVKAVNYTTNKKENLQGVTVVYAGYPADLEMSIFNGMVSKCDASSFIMQSFALPGSSGSVVFDNSGKVVGVLSAVKVGFTGVSPFPQMYPSLVYVSRLTEYSRASIKKRIALWKNLK